MLFDPAHPLLLACRALSAAFDAHDASISARLHVSRNELRLLNQLEDGPNSQVAIAAHLRVTRAAVTAMVDRLAKEGLVNRQPSNSDRRVNFISLTPKVWQALAEHYGPAGRRVLGVADVMSPTEVEELTARLRQLASALDPAP